MTPQLAPAPATRQDIENLRNDLRDHEKQDREDFKETRSAISQVKHQQDQWNGAIGTMKFFCAMGGASCLAGAGAVLIFLVRHWN